MFAWKDKIYQVIIGYGIGNYYEAIKRELLPFIKLDYLCDRKWEDSNKSEYDGIPLIKIEDLRNFQNVLIIIFSANTWVYESIKSDLSIWCVECVHVNEVIGINCMLSGKELKEMFPNGIYEDKRGNKIYFDQSLSDNLKILLRGSNNSLRIGKNISIGNLSIRFGNNGSCGIGDNTEIVGAAIEVSEASVQIGENCLLSAQVVLRAHDGHHIFDKNSHKRINYSRNIVVEDNVWIAYRAILLGGARIGIGSIVGANAVTSSQFDDHQIIVGSPAKVIRENVCWSKDDTYYFNRNFLEECISQEALRYI